MIVHKRTARQIDTRHTLDLHEWEELERLLKIILPNGGKPKKKNIPKAVEEAAQQISDDAALFKTILSDFTQLFPSYTADDVVAEFYCRKTGKGMFAYMENIILRQIELHHTGTAKNYRSAMLSFKHFRQGREVNIEDIDKTLMENYQSRLLDTNITPNTVSFYMRVLRAVYNRATDEFEIPDKRPFRRVFTGIERTFKRAITLRQMKRIRRLELTQYPKLSLARDVFFFLFFCRGMSFVDAAYLKKTDIRYGIITYRRHKTGQVMRVKMEKEISQILSRYAVKDSPYLLPLIKKTDGKERNQYEAALRRINKDLKYIAAMAGISVPLTTYVSRHTWATIAKYKHVPLSVISDALGHGSEQTTQIYLASMDNATIDRANELIIKDLLT